VRPRRIEVTVDAVVLHGARATREELAAALGRELAGLGGREVSPAGSVVGRAEVELRHGERAGGEAIGRAAGRAVREAMSR
jgi:hypothetical protein